MDLNVIRHDQANRLLSMTTAGITTSYTYDKNGNRITKTKNGLTTTYGYDLENRLTSVNQDTYQYDSLGRRIKAVINGAQISYYYDDSEVIVERGAVAKSYTRTPGIDGGIGGIVSQTTPTVTQYFHFDHLGSTTVLTNTAGTAGNKYEYDAFGNLISALDPNDPNSYRFSGKENDSSSGLVYFGARYYDPEVGRWLSPDPSGISDGLNLYLYVNRVC